MTSHEGNITGSVIEGTAVLQDQFSAIALDYGTVINILTIIIAIVVIGLFFWFRKRKQLKLQQQYDLDRLERKVNDQYGKTSPPPILPGNPHVNPYGNRNNNQPPSNYKKNGYVPPEVSTDIHEIRDQIGTYGHVVRPTNPEKRFTLNIETMLLIGVIAMFPLVGLAYVSNEALLIAILVGFSTSLPIGFALGVIFSSAFRLKLLRKLTRRNYGFIRFIYGKTVIKPIIANLDKDVIRFKDSIYIVHSGFIKRYLSESLSEEPEAVSEISKSAKFEEGIPVIYFDYEDLLPVDFYNQPGTEETKYRIASHAAATLNKEIAVEKAIALKSLKKSFDILSIIILAAAAAGAFFGYTLFTDQAYMLESQHRIDSIVSSIGPLIPGLQTITTAGTEGNIGNIGLPGGG